MEGKTWRKIRRPTGDAISIHEDQGQLCLCTTDIFNISQLSIWILEDYGTNTWTLKHTVTTLELFEQNIIELGSEVCDANFRVIAIHPKWNMIFFIGEQRTIIAYDLDRRKVHVISALVIRYHRCRVMKEDMSRPYYIPYVPLFSDSLAEE